MLAFTPRQLRCRASRSIHPRPQVKSERRLSTIATSLCRSSCNPTVNHALEAMQRRLERKPDAMTIRRSTVEHVFGTLKHWMGATHFLTRTLGRVSTEMSLQVLAYNLKRIMNILGVDGAIKAMRMAES
nr:transposase [Paraburkholderia terrae]MDW3656519.1 transposase [Paraburkholderia terrae]